ncbi:ribonuclease P protein component 3 [Methanobrevibacter sp.]|uniref:ribonuclease P protein component 3 n=1 Tax=Methanobrevibacter sp. TaxID=66852 RepID=UPI002602B572|nr:RNase P subunit p30 family protein [uncultured Methanobrevibacter sp.]
MNFHDLNLKGKNYKLDKDLILNAYNLGWKYINLNYSPENFKKAIDYKNELIEDINEIMKIHNIGNKDGIKFDFGVEINPKNQNELYKISKKYRNKSKYVTVLGGDLAVNRAACENRLIDVLSRPYFRNRSSCGINHVLAKEAVRNNVAIELCFNDILSSYLSYRAKTLAYFREIIKLYNKFKFPLIITSGASSIWEMKSPRDILAIFNQLGLSQEDLELCLVDYPSNLVEFNNDRENMIVIGVKKIDKKIFDDL